MTTGHLDRDINFAVTDPKSIGEQIRHHNLSATEIASQLGLANSSSTEAVYAFTRGLVSTQTTVEQ